MIRDFDPPILINVRDRLTPLLKLITWLENAGYEDIILLDNASTYEPLLEYLRVTPHARVRLHANLGSRAIWRSPDPYLATMRSGWFVYTDPDIVPLDECPDGAVDHLHAVLDAHPEHTKAALGLYLRDVPEPMLSLKWEHRLLQPHPSDAWKGFVGRINGSPVYDSLSDTTFALYRPAAPFALEALRTGFPYQARHDCQAWYGGDLTTEDRYYLEHATGADEQGSSWKDAVACE